MSSRRRAPAPAPGSAAGELRKLAAFARQGGPGTLAARLAAELGEAAGNADAQAVRRLAEKAGADPQVAAATLGVLAFALADTARRLSMAQASLGATPGKPE